MSSDFSILSSAFDNVIDLAWLDFFPLVEPFLNIADGASQLIGMFA